MTRWFNSWPFHPRWLEVTNNHWKGSRFTIPKREPAELPGSWYSNSGKTTPSVPSPSRNKSSVVKVNLTARFFGRVRRMSWILPTGASMVKNVLMKVRPMASCRFPPEGEGGGWCWWLVLVAVLFFLTEKKIGCPNGGGSCKLEMIETSKRQIPTKTCMQWKKGTLVV